MKKLKTLFGLLAFILSFNTMALLGFSEDKKDTGKIKSIFLCGIGYGDKNKLFPRSPRLDFDEACRII
jgi:hypothetical protein